MYDANVSNFSQNFLIYKIIHAERYIWFKYRVINDTNTQGPTKKQYARSDKGGIDRVNNSKQRHHEHQVE